MSKWATIIAVLLLLWVCSFPIEAQIDDDNLIEETENLSDKNDEEITASEDQSRHSLHDWIHRCEQDDPLGMISGGITDAQLMASSTSNAPTTSWSNQAATGLNSCHPRYARLYQPNSYSWCAKFMSASEWIQVDLGVPAMITGVMTQGRGDGAEWVSAYMISYSEDSTHWRYIMDQYGNQKIFEGNSDSFTVKHNYLDSPVIARYVKIHTYTWHIRPSLRFELVGCQPCKQLLGVPPYARYSASTSRGARAKRSCTPEYGHYLSNKAWCPLRNAPNQWYQIDVGPPTLITGLILKGRGDSKWAQHVTKFKVSYSNDTKLWYYYKDAAPLDPKIFDGNSEQIPEKLHFFNVPFVARYIRVHPILWYQRIAMRVGLLGCRQNGKCNEGFFKINDQSSCVANLAYKKSAYINGGTNKHTKRHSNDGFGGFLTDNNLYNTMLADGRGYDPWVDEIAQRTVDGYTGFEDVQDTELLPRKESREPPYKNYAGSMLSDQPVPETGKIHQCAILEHTYPYTNNPTLFVDLREATPINGVVIFTAGRGTTTASRRLIARSLNVPETVANTVSTADNLDRLTVYIEDGLRPANGKPGPNARLCGYVTRLNNAIFQQKLHISCVGQGLVGRYVYVEASGLRGRWPQSFSAVLCELMVY